MKRTILSLMMAIGIISAASAFAQQASNNPTTTCTRTTCQNACPVAQPGKAPKIDMMAPFAHLNLTDAQKQQIEKINNETIAQRQQLAKDRKSDKRDSKARRDSLKRQERSKRIEARQAARNEYLAKIKQVLTPEQYTQFLENSYTSAQKAGKPKDGRHHGSKNMRHARARQ